MVMVAGTSEKAVGNQAAGNRSEINKPGVETEDGRGEGLDREGATKIFDQMAEGLEPRDIFDVARVEEVLDHVKDQKRLHPVVGKPFPRFGKGDVTKATRVTDETAILRIMHRARVLPPTPFGKRCDVSDCVEWVFAAALR